MGDLSNDLVERIIAFYLGVIPDDEKERLDTWVRESRGNEEDFKQILKMCQRYRLRFSDEKANLMKARILNRSEQLRLKGKKRQMIRVLSYAAMLVFLMGGTFFFYLIHRQEQLRTLPKVSLLETRHGERVATLRLASGVELSLSDQKNRVFEIAEGVIMRQDSVQRLDTGNTNNQEYSTVIVPHGGEYNLTLADGTNVWLNSGSKLKFPSCFANDQRVIYLEGEAFFEVKSNPQRPFIVKTNEADITVLGTSFNVMSYEEEARVEVALLNGKVEFTVNQTQQICALNPGEVVRMDKKTSVITQTREDVDRLSAWRTGYFYFENMPMEELVVKLERWYQVKFTFANDALKQMCFTGAVTKYRDLGYVLKMIEKTKDVAFVDYGDQIKVYQK